MVEMQVRVTASSGWVLGIGIRSESTKDRICTGGHWRRSITLEGGALTRGPLHTPAMNASAAREMPVYLAYAPGFVLAETLLTKLFNGPWLCIFPVFPFCTNPTWVGTGGFSRGGVEVSK